MSLSKDFGSISGIGKLTDSRKTSDFDYTDSDVDMPQLLDSRRHSNTSKKRRLPISSEGESQQHSEDEIQNDGPSSSTPMDGKRAGRSAILYSHLSDANVTEKRFRLIEKKLDYLIKQNDLIVAEIKKRNSDTESRKKEKEQIDVPNKIRSGIHDAYKSGQEEKNLQWVTKEGTKVMKSTSAENKNMTDFIYQFTKGLYPSTEDGIIKEIEIEEGSDLQKDWVG